MLGLLVRLTSRTDATDLLHETFVRVYQARPQQHAVPAKYLVRAAVTTALDYLRRRERTHAATADYVAWLTTSRAPPPASAERRVLLREIDDATQQLSPADQALLATYAECTNIAAEAERIGIPSTTLRSRYYAAIRRLRRKLVQ